MSTALRVRRTRGLARNTALMSRTRLDEDRNYDRSTAKDKGLERGLMRDRPTPGDAQRGGACSHAIKTSPFLILLNILSGNDSCFKLEMDSGPLKCFSVSTK